LLFDQICGETLVFGSALVTIDCLSHTFTVIRSLFHTPLNLAKSHRFTLEASKVGNGVKASSVFLRLINLFPQLRRAYQGDRTIRGGGRDGSSLIYYLYLFMVGDLVITCRSGNTYVVASINNTSSHQYSIFYFVPWSPLYATSCLCSSHPRLPMSSHS
jgi:hypothetical protein